MDALATWLGLIAFGVLVLWARERRGEPGREREDRP